MSLGRRVAKCPPGVGLVISTPRRCPFCSTFAESKVLESSVGGGPLPVTLDDGQPFPGCSVWYLLRVFVGDALHLLVEGPVLDAFRAKHHRIYLGPALRIHLRKFSLWQHEVCALTSRLKAAAALRVLARHGG